MDRVSVPLERVEVSSSDPETPCRRTEDRARLRDQDWRTQFVAGFKWSLAPVVRHWVGLSLIRVMAIYIAVTTGDLAHDWIGAVKDKAELGASFTFFVLGGFFLAVVTGLGEKYFDKLLTIIAAKLGVVLVNVPVPDILKEKPADAAAPAAAH